MGLETKILKSITKSFVLPNSEIQVKPIIFHIVPDDKLSLPLILGCDFLKAFNIKLTQSKKSIFPKLVKKNFNKNLKELVKDNNIIRLIHEKNGHLATEKSFLICIKNQKE